MTKPVKLVLILSIAVNAILLFGAAAGWLSFGKTSRDGNVAQAASGKDGALSPRAAGEVVALLSTNDFAALRDQLRALGLPEDTVRKVVEKRIYAPYMERVRKLNETVIQAALQRPYWRVTRAMYTPAQSQELNEAFAMAHEARKQVNQIMGVSDIPSYTQIHYAFLPPEKAEQLADMETDYNLMRYEVVQQMANFRTPGDEAKLKLLDDERKRDVDAILTPDEKLARDLRYSDAGFQLQGAVVGFNATEDEYKTIFSLLNAVYEKYPNSMVTIGRLQSGADMTEFYRARNEAQNEADAQIKAALGDERYAEYERSQRQDYQSLQAAAQRFNLGADTVAQTYQARDDAANEAKRISDDTSLSAAQKNEAYAALAEQATAQIKASLGDDVGNAYINNALTWLKNLPKGGTVKIDSNGNVKVSQPKPKSP